MNRIITVGREFGSGGREIGRKIAQELGIAYYDHEIVTELIRRTNLAEEYIRSIEEKNPVPVFAVTTGRTFLSISNPLADQQVSILSEEGRIIQDMAEKSDCVIVGRRADYILRDKKPLRLFIYAGMDFKMQRCREWEHFGEEITDKALRQKIQSVDKERAKYYEFMTGQKWGDKANYDICLKYIRIGHRKDRTEHPCASKVDPFPLHITCTLQKAGSHREPALTFVL